MEKWHVAGLIVTDLAVHFSTRGEDAYTEFAALLNDGDADSMDKLKQLPGYIPAARSVARNESKGAVLQKMDTLQVDRLPVVDGEGKFVGAIERSQLTASLILDVVRRLDGGGDAVDQ